MPYLEKNLQTRMAFTGMVSVEQSETRMPYLEKNLQTRMVFPGMAYVGTFLRFKSIKSWQLPRINCPVLN
jgi:hypothetical protein